MGTYGGLDIVTDGLVFSVDAANKKSYPGSGTSITDLSGNGNTGTLTNGPTFNGVNAGTIDFDGANDYISFSDNTGLNNQSISMESWSKLDSVPQSGFLFEKGSVNTQYSNFYNNNNGLFYFRTKGLSTEDLNFDYTAYVSTSTWNHIVCTYASGIKTIYYNGVIVAQATGITGTISTNTTGLFVGRHGSGGYPMNGKIAVSKVYNKALTAAEVFQNYNATKHRFSIRISYMIATGGTITTIGDYKIHTFTSSGTFEVTSAAGFIGSHIVNYLIVAGGGGGGYETGGGGGAGGLLQSSHHHVSRGKHTVTIGAGGAGATNNNNGANGADSSVFSITADGGGVGGRSLGSNTGKDGGSGGGGKRNFNAGGSATSGQGNDGGQGGAGTGTYVACAGGGGGAGVVGQAGGVRGTGYGGNGGDGLQIDISGTNTYYAGGGGGGSYEQANVRFGLGGNGGGGRAASLNVLAVAGTANTGGGGGGGGLHNSGENAKWNGAAGGSGIIIIKYKFQ